MKNLFLTICLAYSMITVAQKNEYQLSSHILDVSEGKPAVGVTIILEKYNESAKTWTSIDEKVTDQNGRITDFLYSKKSNVGIYKLRYLTSNYFKMKNEETFYPFIEVVFEIKNEGHCHVPITLSAFGYSTYRGN